MFSSAALNAAVQQDVLTLSLHRRKKKRKEKKIPLLVALGLLPALTTFFFLLPLLPSAHFPQMIAFS